MINRIDGRRLGDLRQISFALGVNPYAEGSVEVSFGNTKVFVTASVERERPKWMREGDGGWITAEYGMLPRSTHTRNSREAASGKQSGRTLEIQRLIGRSLRAAVDLSSLEGITIKIDCDVIVADGGTRTAAICGGWVALSQAISRLQAEEVLRPELTLRQIAAVSAGIVDGEAMLDLCYEEDSNAEFDLNLVFNDQKEIIEIQGTAERKSLSFQRLAGLVEMVEVSIDQIMTAQRSVLSNSSGNES